MLLLLLLLFLVLLAGGLVYDLQYDDNRRRDVFGCLDSGQRTADSSTLAVNDERGGLLKEALDSAGEEE